MGDIFLILKITEPFSPAGCILGFFLMRWDDIFTLLFRGIYLHRGYFVYWLVWKFHRVIPKTSRFVYRVGSVFKRGGLEKENYTGQGLCLLFDEISNYMCNLRPLCIFNVVMLYNSILIFPGSFSIFIMRS